MYIVVCAFLFILFSVNFFALNNINLLYLTIGHLYENKFSNNIINQIFKKSRIDEVLRFYG